MTSYWSPNDLSVLTTEAHYAFLRNGTTQVPVIRPNLGSGIVVTAGNPAWVLGAWSEVTPANDLAAHALIGISFQIIDSVSYQIEIGVGAAGSEVVIWRDYAQTQTATPVNHAEWIWPAAQIPANARVAARLASSVALTAHRVNLIFLPRPF